MADVRIGALTRLVLITGLLAFAALSLFPGLGFAALYVTALTPIAAASLTGIELIVRNERAAGISLLLSVVVIAAGLFWGIR